nr:MAG TPA: hypothetical protein [Caudoviricetes sp.]
MPPSIHQFLLLYGFIVAVVLKMYFFIFQPSI